jgi:hypothetical protein
MRNVVTLIIVASLAWYGYSKYQARAGRELPSSQLVERASAFTCDGRTRCSQMTSCEEATYFVKHCPNTKMDGDGDGVPCESQWCER